jgi:putative phosphoesterase
MRRIAALYDIHGNLPALEAVLEEVREAEVQMLVIGGDVMPGPMARETLRHLLRIEIPLRFIQGNGEVDALAEASGARATRVPERAREAVRWSAAQLFPEYETTVAAWDGMLRLEIAELGAVVFCHATPRDENEIFTRLTPEESLRPIFAKVDATVVVCGHTHMQFDRRIGPVRVVNAGSVGMPFGRPGADWLLLDRDVYLRHTVYDLTKAAARIRATSYPQVEEFARDYILRPPSEEQMLQAFTSVASR